MVLVLAGGVGGAVAGGHVTSAQLRDDTVRSVDVRDDTLRSRDIANGTIRWRDLAPWVKQRAREGAPGGSGLSGLEIVEVPRVMHVTGQFRFSADCPTGKKVIGGGIGTHYPATVEVQETFAIDEDSWAVSVANTRADHEMTVQAICVTAD